MKSNYSDVELFHQKYGLLPENAQPHLLEPDVFEFRAGFMQEELMEFATAYDRKDLAKAFDALIDLVYVAMGTAVLMSLPWEKGWDAVQAANMQKIRAASAAASAAGSGRGHSLDVIKPPGWQAPDIEGILKAHSAMLRRALGQLELSGVLGNEQNLPNQSLRERVAASGCCTAPDVDVPKLVCGHPLPCPRHTQTVR